MNDVTAMRDVLNRFRRESLVKRTNKIVLTWFCAVTFFVTTNGHAQSMTLEQVLQNVMDHYPSLITAAIQVERAKQNNRKIESQLGWQLGAQAGIGRDITLFGTPSDRMDLTGNFTRTLESGASIGVEAGVLRDDSVGVFSPVIPNPSISTSFDLSYRQPLAQGSDNPAYKEGLVSARADVIISTAERKALYDQLASQVIDIYMALANTHVRTENISRSVKRTLRLQKYINSRATLGVSEEKDILQANAQLSRQQAELKGLQMLWQQQRISLVRLMGKDSELEIKPVPIKKVNLPEANFKTLFQQVLDNNPQVQLINGRIKQADSAIRVRRDARDDSVDLVFSIGNRTLSGDVILGGNLGGALGGNISESEVTGGVRLEYQHGFDSRGEDAELYQAQLDRSAALLDKRQITEDLHYDLSSLLAEIKVGNDALKAYQKSVVSERDKLDEAVKRYRRGRADTDQLISFEEQLSEAELSFELQRIELARRYRNLSLLQGLLLKNIRLSEYDGFITDRYGDQR